MPATSWVRSTAASRCSSARRRSNSFSSITSFTQRGASAPSAGALTFVPDNDGVVRRVPLVLRVGDQLVPSLVTELLRIGQGADNYLVRMGPSSNPGIAEIRIGQVVVPTTRNGALAAASQVTRWLVTGLG